MSEKVEPLVSDDFMHKLLRDEIYRVCNGTRYGDYISPYPKWSQHDDLVSMCKACNQDTTELENALDAAKGAIQHLKCITDIMTSHMRSIIDSKR